MKKAIIAAVLTFTIAGTALAADVVLNDANKDQVRKVLTEQGYEVKKIKLEDGYYEAYAKKDDERIEVLLNGDFEIVKTEQD